MSMDEMLLNELYGSEEARADEEVKLAQVELVEAVAVEAGVNLNELDDDELAKFAHYVLSDEDELIEQEDAVEHEKLAALEEADLMGRQMAHSYLDELTTIGGDDNMYYEEDLYGDDLGYEEDVQVKVASAMQDVADAWHMQKLAEEDNSGRNAAIGAGIGAAALGGGAMAARAGARRQLASAKKGLGSAQKDLNVARLGVGGKFRDRLAKLTADHEALGTAKGLLHGQGGISYKPGQGSTASRIQAKQDKIQGNMKKVRGLLEKVEGKFDSSDKAKELQEAIKKSRGKLDDVKGSRLGSALRGLSGAQLAGLGAGGAALAGGGAYLMSRRKKQEKSAALAEYGYEALAIANLYEPDEFAKEAEYRAAEILIANGVHPETFEDIYPEEVKIASFPGVEDAIDYDEAEELEAYNDMLDTAAIHIIEQLLD